MIHLFNWDKLKEPVFSPVFLYSPVHTFSTCICISPIKEETEISLSVLLSQAMLTSADDMFIEK